MNKKICCSLVLCFSIFTGCVTTSTKSNDGVLQAKVTTLEKRVKTLRQQQDKMRKTIQAQALEQHSMNKKLSECKAPRMAGAKSGRFAAPSNKDVQTALKNAGYYTGAIDGKIGPKSRNAIMKFQEENDVKVDGIVGRSTWELLGEYL